MQQTDPYPRGIESKQFQKWVLDPRKHRVYHHAFVHRVKVVITKDGVCDTVELCPTPNFVEKQLLCSNTPTYMSAMGRLLVQ
jgi:hypothetical protein